VVSKAIEAMEVNTGAGGGAGAGWAGQITGRTETEVKSRAAFRQRERAKLGIAESSVAVQREQSTATERFRAFSEYT
jgi:hypothetical protein